MGKTVYIVEGKRTPFCKIGTTYKDMSAAYLGSEVVKSLITNSCITVDDIDEVVFGCVSQPADTMNIARYIAMHSGIPKETPAVSVHRNCASGMEAITYCSSKIQSGECDVLIAGGTENMSQMPLLYNKSAVTKFGNIFKSRTLMKRLINFCKFRPKDFIPDIGLKLGLSDTLCDMNMGQTAEVLAREYSISRLEQDRYASISHEKANAGQMNLSREMVPVYIRNDDCIKSYSGEYTVPVDNGPRKDSTVAKLSKLRPVFSKGGTVTAGNSSQLTDGAAGVILMSEAGLKKTGCTPVGKITSFAYAGCDPKRMGIGPVPAVKKAGIDVKKADLIEINEAFAAQTLAVIKELSNDGPSIDHIQNITNVNGGSTALGHPVGATGARLVVTLLNHARSISVVLSLFDFSFLSAKK